MRLLGVLLVITAFLIPVNVGAKDKRGPGKWKLIESYGVRHYTDPSPTWHRGPASVGPEVRNQDQPGWVVLKGVQPDQNGPIPLFHGKFSHGNKMNY